jgi:transport and Golgi organization protein 2
MCTLSFIPNDSGYMVGVNRDEQIARARSLPPAIIGKAIYPREPSTDGTWIAVNSSGVTLALLNKNEDGPLAAKLRSRGEFIPALISAESLAAVHRRLLEIGFKGVWPFRLIAISAEEREVCEWAWGTQLTQNYYEWQQRQWFSSGMSDHEANRVRSAVVEHAWKQPDAGSPQWLRELHRSHEPQKGAFSICVHRDDATTVSYSEIVVGGGLVTFRYAAGHPCQYTAFDSELSLPMRFTAQAVL